MTKHRMHYRDSAIEKVVLPRHLGYRGVVNVKKLFESQDGVLNIKAKTMKEFEIQWRQKASHGNHPNTFDQNKVGSEASNIWLRKGVLYPEREGFVIAIHDKVVSSRNSCKHVLNRDVVDRELNASENWNEGSDPRNRYRHFLDSERLHEEAKRQKYSLFAETSQHGQMQTHSQNLQHTHLQQSGQRGMATRMEPDTRLTLGLPQSHELDERRKTQLQKKLQKEFPLARIEVHKAPVIIKCFHQQIRAYTAMINFSTRAVLCEIASDPPIISFLPSAAHRKAKNAYATCDCRNSNIICIAYLDETGKIFGVTPPPQIGTKFQPDDPARLIPTELKPFITCKNHEYQLTLDPHSHQVINIELLPKNRLPTDKDGKIKILTDNFIICCGIRFKGYRKSKSRLAGAELYQDGIPQKLFNSKYVVIVG
ncbi:uncharacterized protein LOC117173809 [Belonocnema kinseyi]|uniref:uncharacterized protein LOC117173809 n=1 Tax=Belonocnema kinseyi TaxID=2817044 RepID=UPI00143D6A8E|nr:uncharacterized protein LOC117173809 [Belonocnema kinseyi]